MNQIRQIHTQKTICIITVYTREKCWCVSLHFGHIPCVFTLSLPASDRSACKTHTFVFWHIVSECHWVSMLYHLEVIAFPILFEVIYQTETNQQIESIVYQCICMCACVCVVCMPSKCHRNARLDHSNT